MKYKISNMNTDNDKNNRELNACVNRESYNIYMPIKVEKIKPNAQKRHIITTHPSTYLHLYLVIVYLHNPLIRIIYPIEYYAH